MSKIIWDKSGERLFETGVKNGVLYIQNASGEYPLGIAWNGLVGVSESPSGAEASPLYADDIKYVNLISAEEFGATIEAYMYPDEFAQCDGSAQLATGVYVGQQTRKTFGLVYRTALGNDIAGEAYGYKLHLIYGAIAAPSEKGYQTINDSPEAITLSWDISTTSVEIPGFKPTASIVLNSTKVDATLLATLEDILFGTPGVDPRLPLPTEIVALFAGAAPAALALSTIVPADDAIGIAVAANIVLTFNNKVLNESVVLTSAAGVIVPVAKSFDATGKILTINPTDNLAGGTTYIVTIAGVTDIYGQALASSVKNFATT